jgi:hypothetical protein
MPTPAQKLVSYALESNRKIVDSFKKMGEEDKNVSELFDHEIISLNVMSSCFDKKASNDSVVDWAWCLERLCPSHLAMRVVSENSQVSQNDTYKNSGLARLYENIDSEKEREILSRALALLSRGASGVTIRHFALGYSRRDRSFGFIPVEDHVYRRRN